MAAARRGPAAASHGKPCRKTQRGQEGRRKGGAQHRGSGTGEGADASAYHRSPARLRAWRLPGLEGTKRARSGEAAARPPHQHHQGGAAALSPSSLFDSYFPRLLHHHVHTQALSEPPARLLIPTQGCFAQGCPCTPDHPDLDSPNKKAGRAAEPLLHPVENSSTAALDAFC